MRILISGSTGLVGSALTEAARSQGHDVLRLVRGRPSHDDEIRWTPDTGAMDPPPDGVGAVVHLAGEPIVGRWSDARKKAILDSRVGPTRMLCSRLAEMSSPPRHFLCASASGYYGNRGDEELTEDSPPGSGFLADVSRQWEQACQPAGGKMRVVNLRFAMVLSPRGGALQAMLRPFRMGLGGLIGSGRQYWSWIAIDDVVEAILHVLAHEELSGPVNVTTPDAPTNAEFTAALGLALHRPTVMRVPPSMARLIMGEMADEVLLASTRMVPRKLIDSGMQFEHTDLRQALRSMLRE